MFVKVIVSFQWKGVQLEKGITLVLPDEDARSLIKNKRVVPAMPPSDSGIEKPEEKR